MDNPELRLHCSRMFNLDLRREEDGSLALHIWEPMGSLHSSIGMTDVISADEVAKLKEFLSNEPINRDISEGAKEAW